MDIRQEYDHLHRNRAGFCSPVKDPQSKLLW